MTSLARPATRGMASTCWLGVLCLARNWCNPRPHGLGEGYDGMRGVAYPPACRQLQSCIRLRLQKHTAWHDSLACMRVITGLCISPTNSTFQKSLPYEPYTVVTLPPPRRPPWPCRASSPARTGATHTRPDRCMLHSRPPPDDGAVCWGAGPHVPRHWCRYVCGTRPVVRGC